MALVLQDEALQLLQGQVPVPAVVQEFVNHGGVQYKVYVLGNKVRDERLLRPHCVLLLCCKTVATMAAILHEKSRAT